MAWKRITIKTTADKADQISDFLWDIGCISSSFVDNEDDPIFEPELNKTILWKNTNIIALFEEETDVESIVGILEKAFPDENFDPLCEFVPDADWERVWMDNYHPMKFGEKLWICPTNHTVEEKNAVVVTLDPGLAFGTGTHPTTRMCLQWLDMMANNGLLAGKTIVDYGCGSGILAVAAVLLGAKKAYCVDIDYQAIDATKYNAQNNNVDKKIETFLVKDFPTEIKSDIVIANILAGPLVELSPTLANICKSHGHIALSGILDIKEQDIIQAYSPYFTINDIQHDEEWLAFSGVRKGNEE